MRTLILACGLAALLLATPAAAQEIVAGRPGNTESPVAAPTGHWQVESELASYAESDDAESWSVAATTFRYGLVPSWDAEAIAAPLNGADGETGFGDVTLRLRKTLRDGDRAFGVIGYVTLPTAEDGFGADEVEGGVIATGTFVLEENWGVTWTGGVGAVSIDDDYEASVFGGAALSYGLSESTGVYGELFAERVDGETEALLQVGATHLVASHTQVDAGVEFGLTGEADDFRVFVGLARLF